MKTMLVPLDGSPPFAGWFVRQRKRRSSIAPLPLLREAQDASRRGIPEDDPLVIGHYVHSVGGALEHSEQLCLL